MAQQITPFTISAPGFLGLNIQDSPIDLNTGFALEADNCIIDKSGRTAARKGWVKLNAANTDLSTSDITCLGELIGNDGTSTILAAGGGFLFKYSGGTLTTLTYGGGGVAPTISANNWQFTQLNGIALFFQRGYDPLIYDPVVSTTTFRRLSEKTAYSGTVPLANTAISAYGRIWCADISTNKNTITWSDIITPQIWTGGTSGSLNLLGVWPNGGDEIVALAAHNNFLIIFGKKQTLVYSGANMPSTMVLSDAISNIGCIARDSVQNTGEDVIFLSNTGVRSLARTIQEKSSPLFELSKNVRDEIRFHIITEIADNIKSVYSGIDAFYLITFPSFDEVYCFDLKKILEDGSVRTTTWSKITPKCYLATSSKKLYLGKAGYIGEYSGYLDDTAKYRMKYYSTWIDFGNPIQTSILKKILFTIIGTTNQDFVCKYAFDFIENYNSKSAQISSSFVPAEYGIAEYGIAEYGSSSIVKIISINCGGSGRFVQIGLEADVNNSQLSIQKIDIFTKNGRL